MKKNIFLVIVLIICFSNLVFANINPIDQATNALTKMKIIIGNENGDLMLDKHLTRAEFATIITRLLSLENSTVSNPTILFFDVDNTFWGYNNIYKCVEKGYLLGDGNGLFRPNDSIKYEEVLTIMLRILSEDANLTIWPDDYIQKANKLNMTQNINLSSGDYIARSDAFIIIYNCLSLEIQKK